MSSLTNIEKRRVKKHFDAKADCYESSAVLQREVCDRMLERLDLVTLKPERVLDAGSGTGWATQHLLERYKNAQVLTLDLSESMLKQSKAKGGWFRKPGLICADAEFLPLADNSVDIVFSNLMLQWCDVKKVFAEFQRVLKVDGLLMFSSFGPDTLKELRHSWQQVDDKVHVNNFIDMHDLGDELLHCGFAEPVMDMDMIQLTYQDAKTVMTDLKNIGANTPVSNQVNGLVTPRKFQKVLDAYEKFRVDELLPASFEVVYGHAWKTDKPIKRKMDNPDFTIPLDKFTKSL